MSGLEGSAWELNEDRRPSRTKFTVGGKIKGRPSGDGICGPPKIKRTTNPGKTTLDIVERIALAAGLLTIPMVRCKLI